MAEPRKPPGPGSLVVVGTGITLAAHPTIEAIACMREAEILFYQVVDPATAAWIKRLNPAASTLDDCYEEGTPLWKGSSAVTRRLVTAVARGSQVCAAFYGHPTVFVTASNQAIRSLRRKGFPVRIVPGVSALDCLFADLGVDPGVRGCQSFEATDFLAYRRRYDSRSDLILWQVGVLGERNVRRGISTRPERLRLLTDALRRQYPSQHRVVLYEASTFPGCPPTIKRIPLEKLPREKVLPITTLYLPARPDHR
jgi:uncharacterized protein YabN with tetrapyrrole methylase and pyrophosphatase domain